MGSVLQLPLPVCAELEALASVGYPNESCGLLVGRGHDGACAVVRLRRARNLNTERARDRYELDPADYLAAEREAETAGLGVVGIWHTHPDHPARPSATDREWAWPGWSYLILSVGRDGVTEMRSWRLAGGEFAEEDIRHG
jgi:proteasome lid subunit RPN8/RPN11